MAAGVQRLDHLVLLVRPACGDEHVHRGVDEPERALLLGRRADLALEQIDPVEGGCPPHSTGRSRHRCLATSRHGARPSRPGGAPPSRASLHAVASTRRPFRPPARDRRAPSSRDTRPARPRFPNESSSSTRNTSSHNTSVNAIPGNRPGRIGQTRAGGARARWARRQRELATCTAGTGTPRVVPVSGERRSTCGASSAGSAEEHGRADAAVVGGMAVVEVERVHGGDRHDDEQQAQEHRGRRGDESDPRRT